MLQKSPVYAYIPARDMSRARQFYEGKLGFVPKEETAGGVVYEFGGGTACFMYMTPNAGTSKASQAFWSAWCSKATTCRAREVRAAPSRKAARRPRGSRTAKGTSWRSSNPCS